MDSVLKLEWANWLTSLPWDFFLTITSREPIPAHRGESVLHAIGKQLCARFRPEMVFLGAEAHLSQAMHYHGLYRGTEDRSKFPDSYWRLYASDIFSVLFDTYGRSKVECVRGQGAVSAYVSKYCVKSTGTYQLFGRQDWPETDGLALQGHFLPPVVGVGGLTSEPETHEMYETHPSDGRARDGKQLSLDI